MTAIQPPQAPPLETTAFDDAGGSFRGELLLPTSPGYETARRIWNGAIDRHPACIARCTGVPTWSRPCAARGRDLEIAVRGGGHNVAGTAVCDDGIVIDLSAMRAVTVDPVERTAVVQGGAVGDVDHETQAHGLATPPAASWATPASPGSPSAAASASSCANTGSPSTTCLPPRWSPPRAASSGRPPTNTPICSGRCEAAAATSASSPRSGSLRPVGPTVMAGPRLLGGRGHHRRPALLPGLRHRRARRARERHPARHDPTAAGGRRGPALPPGHRGGQLLRRISRGR